MSKTEQPPGPLGTGALVGCKDKVKLMGLPLVAQAEGPPITLRNRIQFVPKRRAGCQEEKSSLYLVLGSFWIISGVARRW
jgi:hypothetical protein